ncbi:hypothetical protein [Catalinimonas alkaloidigena]|nr:hypothetical protein [Catalinimonas alkaloidigena]
MVYPFVIKVRRPLSAETLTDAEVLDLMRMRLVLEGYRLAQTEHRLEGKRKWGRRYRANTLFALPTLRLTVTVQRKKGRRYLRLVSKNNEAYYAIAAFGAASSLLSGAWQTGLLMFLIGFGWSSILFFLFQTPLHYFWLQRRAQALNEHYNTERRRYEQMMQLEEEARVEWGPIPRKDVVLLVLLLLGFGLLIYGAVRWWA